jgi:V/A-type H+/Na+-transporting ATPase subunit E
MKTAVDDNIDALSRAIMNEAQSDAERILEEARQKADTIRKQAQEQAAQERQRILERAQQEAARIRSQSVATTQLKSRTMQLDHREKLLNNVFKAAQQELPSVQQWTDYPEIAQNLLREALTQLKAEEVTVRADAKTQAVLDQAFLDQVSRENNTKITMGPPLERGIGVMVDTANGRLQYDNTLETRLRRMQADMRSPVYHQLMGEKV